MILGLLQARTGSSRLPGKVLRPLAGKPMLARQIERLQRARTLDRLIVATSVDPADDAIETLCRALEIACFRGSLTDVLDRLYQAAARVQPRHVVRLTADCPLIDPAILDRVVQQHTAGGYDYVSNALHPTFPDGLDVEALRFECLQAAWREAVLPSHREHVTPYVHSQPGRFRLGEVRHAVDLSHLRWTVDVAEDLAFVEKVYAHLLLRKPVFGMQDVLALLDEHPELQRGAAPRRNEGLLRSQAQDRVFLERGKGKT